MICTLLSITLQFECVSPPRVPQLCKTPCSECPHLMKSVSPSVSALFCHLLPIQRNVSPLLSCTLYTKPASPPQLSSHPSDTHSLAQSPWRGGASVSGALQKRSLQRHSPSPASCAEPVLSCLLSLCFLAHLGTEAHTRGRSSCQ